MPDYNKLNKKILINELKRNIINKVVIHFSGCGDSGQIDDIIFMENDEQRQEVEKNEILYYQTESKWIKKDRKWKTTSKKKPGTLYALTMSLGDHLTTKHDHDWWNNDGGHGTVELNLEEKLIKFDFNIAFIQYDTHYHTESLE